MNELKTLIEGLRGRRKLNIYQRVLRLALLGSLLTFVLDKNSDEESAKKILAAVNVEVKNFVADAQQSDDMTMLAFVLRG